MPYIGNQPAEQFTSFATQEFSTSATTSYTLDHAVTNENEIALFINNVRQQPGSGKAYTATGTALTLSAATASTDTMYCVFLGRALQTVTPATNSITAAMVGNDLISGKDALASEPADTDEFLVSDAGTLKRIDYSLIKGGGKVLQVVQTAFTTDTATSNTSYTAVANFEVNITPSATSSKVLVNASFSIESTNSGTLAQYTLYRDDTTNLGNSTYGFGIATYGTSNGRNFASINYLDSPSTTSAVNYQIYQKVDNGGSCKVAGGSAVCTITAMEIGA